MRTVLIGVDAGGTKTALRCDDPAAPRRPDQTAPGVNLQRDGLEASAAVLAGLLGPVLQHIPPARLQAVCLGVSGAGRDEEQRALRDAVRARLGMPDVPLFVTHDAEIALEAVFGAKSGTITIAGTGSVVYGRTQQGEIVRAGGWGARLGDEGSGTAIGQAAARAVARAFDGGPPTALVGLFAARVQIRCAADLLRWTYHAHGAFAELAPLVLHAAPSDAVADGILRLQSDLLLQDVRRLAQQAGDGLAPRLAFLGGLAGEAVYQAYLNAALRRHLPRWQAVEAAAEPVEGAVRRARRWALERSR